MLSVADRAEKFLSAYFYLSKEGLSSPWHVRDDVKRKTEARRQK